MQTKVLSTREINRATLERQALLARTDRSPVEVVEHLVGMHAQVPGNVYTALWSRVVDFDPDAFSRLIEERRVVRVSLQRSTLHLVTAEDCLPLRGLLPEVHLRTLKGAFGRPLAALSEAETAEVVARGRELVEEAPRSSHELGGLLAERWPEVGRQALAMLVRQYLPLVQVPPRGLWQRGGQARHTTVQHWLGVDHAEETTAEEGTAVERLVLRYLAAFGPASVKDAQMWSGLTGLREVFDALRDRLVCFRDEAGAELYDLPDAPRPDADTPAPARLLPEYDNLFYGHADRSRVVTREDQRRTWRGNTSYSVFLADGRIEGVWRLEVDRRRTAGTLCLHPFRPLPRPQRAAVEAEAAALLEFHVPGGANDVRWDETPLWEA
ncbi:AlkZ family DNA glycosylase [Streptomyces durbertensis]|uniref:AlkZ family DNA glycosylase n=1 Tax=Streptomyces durbertensis TaxID=2448886 RepID=A0ABR6EJA7_9ACTN|nr:winged helix DNA-binding domain-containing protein [Streptomyces durbertensis]MBB1245434.1 AlkZ family DNA glycosylase [Streptomyces durbertensis]